MKKVLKTSKNPADRFPGPGPGRPKGMPNKKTQSEKEAAEWAREYAIDSGAYQESWKKTCELARRGVQWAVQMVMERVAGKVMQSVEGEFNLSLHFDYDTNGNGKD